MQFWKFSSQALATILASLAVVSASGPSAGNAIADPDSAVVKLTAKTFKDFLDENPLVLTEFFAPWCGYCKTLGPEISKAADILAESHPSIKIAQVDCTEEADLCQKHEIKGYPTMKIMKGAYQEPVDYDGPREASGIVDHMVKMSLPPVLIVKDVDQFVEDIKSETAPYLVQILPSASHKGSKDANATYGDVAFTERTQMSFYSIEDDKSIAKFNKLVNADLSGKKPKYLLIQPNELDDVRVFPGDEVTKESLVEWTTNAKVPNFGDINRDTYMVYMGSTLPLGYYFYNDAEQRSEKAEFFEKLGKELRGKINFVGLDASQFGRHAEILNMDPQVVPLFAIQDNSNGRKYGLNQTEHPDPSTDAIKKFVDQFLAGDAKPIVKSEALPTEEEIESRAVKKLVAHNYADALADLSKDVFVKYYAPWCGHCKKLAPIWEELAEIFKPSDVVIADVDHTLNDVDTPIVIEGYPTLIFYPANGEIDPKSGMRTGFVYDKQRDLENLLEYVGLKGASGAAVEALKEAADKAKELAEKAKEEVVGDDEEAAEAEGHDEL